MKLKDLKSGQIVFTRNTGVKYFMVLEDRLIAEGMYLPLHLYNDDLLVKEEYREEFHSFDIIRVYKMQELESEQWKYDNNLCLKNNNLSLKHLSHKVSEDTIIWAREDFKLTSEQLTYLLMLKNTWVARDSSGYIHQFTEEPHKNYMDMFSPEKRKIETVIHFEGKEKMSWIFDAFSELTPYNSPILVGDILANEHYLTILKEKQGGK